MQDSGFVSLEASLLLPPLRIDQPKLIFLPVRFGLIYRVVL